MQRALGASEPPGFPMIISPTSPHKEVPANTQKQKSLISTSQKDIPSPVSAKNGLVNIPTTKEKEDISKPISEPIKNVSQTVASLPDKTVATSTSEERLSVETCKEQPGTTQQQPPKVDTSLARLEATLLPDQETEKRGPSQDVTSTAKSSPPTGAETGKIPPQKPSKDLTSIKSTFTTEQEAGKPLPQEPPKAGASPAKPVPTPAPPPKQESGGFFRFGGPKRDPSPAQSAGSMTGKMFGFGSSLLSSASNFITTVQDEPKTTPPTSRKMSATAHISPKTTPPVSPKVVSAKDTKTPLALKTKDKAPDKPQQTPSSVQAKVDKDPSEKTKAPTEKPDPPKADISICPLCKVKLNMGSKDRPNYNTCTQCKTAVCSQCGFKPMSNMTEVNHCLQN